MKVLDVVFRPSAAEDLLAVFDYVADATGNPGLARAFAARIRARCAKIGDAPHGGRQRDDLAPGLRTVPFEKSAVIAYVIEGDCVCIVNIFYAGGISKPFMAPDRRERAAE